MKKSVSILALCLLLFSCSEKEEKGKFTVTGEIKNAENQKIFLEQLFFSEQNPQVLDTAQLVNGKFSLSTIANEEGLYRLRLEKTSSGYIFINDAPSIRFQADINNTSLDGPDFNTPANRSFKAFIKSLDDRRKLLVETSNKLETLKTTKNNDSLVTVESDRLLMLSNDYNKFIIKSVDTASSPSLAMFALGNMDLEMLKTAIPALAKKFPDHQGVAGLVNRYNQMISQQNLPKPVAPSNRPSVGAMAPDFSMADTSGKPFSLSQLKGKYVLVDFWASWCAPCRGENPNVVAAYNKFKNKNFTILGVSLDENKIAWLKAIRDDQLAWKQVSDLKGWNNATVALYGYEGIPYNVLLDPQGKIIATELRDAALEQKLAEVLK